MNELTTQSRHRVILIKVAHIPGIPWQKGLLALNSALQPTRFTHRVAPYGDITRLDMTDHIIEVFYTDKHTWIASMGSETGEGPGIQEALNDLSLTIMSDLMGEYNSSLISYEMKPCKVKNLDSGSIMEGFTFVETRLLGWREVERAIAHWWPVIYADEEWQPYETLGPAIEVDSEG